MSNVACILNGGSLLHIPGLHLHVNICYCDPSGEDSASWSRKRAGGKKGKRETKREREVCVKELFHLHPRIPGEAFHANPFPGVGYSLIRWDNTHICIHIWLISPYCESSAILLLHRDTHRHARCPLGWQWGNEKKQQLGGGVPLHLYRNCSYLEASPCPVLTHCACMCFSTGACLCAS